MKKRTIFLISILFSLLINGCRYDFIIPEEAPPTNNSGNPISFSAQVAPIFSTATKCTACHKSGGQSPDLSFASIVPALVNAGAPEQSMIYSFPAPATGTHTWKKYTAGEAAIILAWIKEGAKNN